MEYKSYGEYLKHLRTEKGLNVAELGEKLNIKKDGKETWKCQP